MDRTYILNNEGEDFFNSGGYCENEQNAGEKLIFE